MLVSLLASTAILIGSSGPLPQTINRPQTATPAATAEGIEILRRILTDSVDKAFDRRDPDATGGYRVGHSGELGGFVRTVWASGDAVTHSRAFHDPSRGILFSLDVRLPTVTREPAAGEIDTEEAHDDEWIRVRSQVRGNVTERLFDGGQHEHLHLEIDPQAVKKLTETLVTTLGRHATRVEGLDSHATLTVLVNLSGSQEAAWSRLNLLMTDEAVEDQAATRQYVLALGADVPEQHMVLELSLADVRGTGPDGVDRLIDRARVHTY